MGDLRCGARQDILLGLENYLKFIISNKKKELMELLFAACKDSNMTVREEAKKAWMLYREQVGRRELYREQVGHREQKRVFDWLRTCENIVGGWRKRSMGWSSRPEGSKLEVLLADCMDDSYCGHGRYALIDLSSYLINVPLEYEEEKQVFEVLVAACKDSNEHVREKAARALVSWAESDVNYFYRNPSHIEFLLKGIKEKIFEPEVVPSLIGTLLYFSSQEFFHNVIVKNIQGLLLNKLSNTRNHEFTKEVFKRFKPLGSSDKTEVKTLRDAPNVLCHSPSATAVTLSTTVALSTPISLTTATTTSHFSAEGAPGVSITPQFGAMGRGYSNGGDHSVLMSSTRRLKPSQIKQGKIWGVLVKYKLIDLFFYKDSSRFSTHEI